MSDMIERVARAICASEGLLPDEVNGLLIKDRPGERPNWEGFEDTARAAIEAMREPTEGMIAAPLHEADGCDAQYQTDADFAAAWAAMIEAALK